MGDVYLNRKNRKYLKDKNIEIVGKPLGRPILTQQTSQQKWKKKKLAAQRNHMEGKFEHAKRGYGLNNIKARLSETSKSWIGCIFFVMNLMRLQKLANNLTKYSWQIFIWLNQLPRSKQTGYERPDKQDNNLASATSGWEFNPIEIKINSQHNIFAQYTYLTQLEHFHRQIG